VGEPEGVRTVVFDLVGASDGESWPVWRLDAEPGEAAMELARAIESCLGSERAAPSIKSLATDGIASRWFPDLESFARANLADLATRDAFA